MSSDPSNRRSATATGIAIAASSTVLPLHKMKPMPDVAHASYRHSSDRSMRRATATSAAAAPVTAPRKAATPTSGVRCRARGRKPNLAAQQKVADAYRAEATRTLGKLAELEGSQQPVQQTLLSFKQEEASARQALATQLQQQQSQLQGALEKSLELQRSESLSDVHRGLDELRAELRSSRQREEEQRLAVTAAKVLVQ